MYVEHVIESEIKSFTIGCVIRIPSLQGSFIKCYERELFCHQDMHEDTCNHHNPFAVCTCKGTSVVGHVPRILTNLCFLEESCFKIKICECVRPHKFCKN